MKAGDVVQLKSGGPKMTVSKVAEFHGAPGRQMALCTWFDSQGKHEEKLFDPVQLKVIEGDGAEG